MNVRAIRPSKGRLAGLGVALAASFGLAQAAGAAPVIRAYVLVVPPAQNVAFSDGIKIWEKCLHDHGARQAVTAYAAETGDLDRYLFLQEYGAWSGMDDHDPAEKVCAPVFRSEVFPHFTHGFSEVAELNTKDSYMPGANADPPAMTWVDSFRIKPGQMQHSRRRMVGRLELRQRAQLHSGQVTLDKAGSPPGAARGRTASNISQGSRYRHACCSQGRVQPADYSHADRPQHRLDHDRATDQKVEKDLRRRAAYGHL